MPEQADQTSTEQPITFEVEVEPGTDPIRGQVRSPGQAVDFVGWVALAGAMERFLNPPAAQK
jgi:hypothetical protein